MLGTSPKSLVSFWVILIAVLSSGVFCQDNDVCADCHDDEDLTLVRRGVETSLYVTQEHLDSSPHEGFDCIECHTDLDGVEEYPHASPLILPDCGACHEDAQEQFISGFFRPLAEKGYTSLPACSDCHGKHEVSWKGHPQRVCGVCHQEILQDFLHSAHWMEPVEASEVTCVSCHSPHFKHEKEAYSPEEWQVHLVQSCSECHEKEVGNYTESRHYVEVERGNLNAPVCSDCHAKHKVLSPRNSESKVSVAKLDMTCTQCHIGYEASIHRPEVGDDPRLETCVVCHTGHSTDMASAASSIFSAGPTEETGLANVCLKCHEEELRQESQEAHSTIHSEKIDVALSGGRVNCGECHQYHYQAPAHPEISAMRQSCGDCHEQQQQEFEESSHFVARARGHAEAPDCVRCHGERDILRTEEIFHGQSSVALCASCHADREMILKFQLSPEVVAGTILRITGRCINLAIREKSLPPVCRVTIIILSSPAQIPLPRFISRISSTHVPSATRMLISILSPTFSTTRPW